jgi:hypothetical protein
VSARGRRPVTHASWVVPPSGERVRAAPSAGSARRRGPGPDEARPVRPGAPPGAGVPRGEGPPASGARAFGPASRGGPPQGLIRLRFADAGALERAGAAFGAASDPGLGALCGDPATLTLRIAGDAGVETLRAVLAVLDAAALTAESLTVHTHELDDVFAAFTGLP